MSCSGLPLFETRETHYYEKEDICILITYRSFTSLYRVVYEVSYGKRNTQRMAGYMDK